MFSSNWENTIPELWFTSFEFGAQMEYKLCECYVNVLKVSIVIN